MHVCVSMHVFLYIYVCTSACLFECIHTIFMCMYVWVGEYFATMCRVSICIYICFQMGFIWSVCIYIWSYVFVFVFLYTCVLSVHVIFVPIRLYIELVYNHVQLLTYMFTLTNSYTHTHIYASIYKTGYSLFYSTYLYWVYVVTSTMCIPHLILGNIYLRGNILVFVVIFRICMLGFGCQFDLGSLHFCV